MGEKFKITPEIMKNANTYISIAMKELIASDLARACVKETYKIKSHEDNSQYQSDYGLSPMYCESPSSKARVMMTVLMSFYLNLWGDDKAFLCDISEYDDLASAHVLNQIERFKSGEYREKAFDLLADYKETEKYLNSAIYSVLRELNDPAKRILDALGNMASAEMMQNTLNQIQEYQAGIKEEIEKQRTIMENGEGVNADGSDG